MKMGCFVCSGVFWGVLLIMLGISVIVKIVFNIHIPIFRILFALTLIYLGIKLLFGWRHGAFWCQDKDTVLFTDRNIEYTTDQDEYNVVFGRGEIDLSKVTVSDKIVKVEVNVVFGEGIVKIPSSVPVKIVGNAAFAGTKMPDGNPVSFGTYSYKSKDFKDETAGYLKLETNVVFGSLRIVQG